MMAGVATALGGAAALIAPRNFRFVAGSGRRKTLMWVSGSGCPVLLPYGSSTAMISNWAVAGTGSWIRMRPLLKRRLYACSPGLHRRHIGGGVVRAIDGPEERIETAGVFEARLDVRRAEAHRILDLVTRHARATVRAEGLEEGIVRVEERSITRRVGRVRSIRVREDLSVRDRCLRRRDELRGTVEVQVNGRRAGRFVALVDMEGEAVGGDDGSSDGERVARAVIIVARRRRPDQHVRAAPLCTSRSCTRPCHCHDRRMLLACRHPD